MIHRLPVLAALTFFLFACSDQSAIGGQKEKSIDNESAIHEAIRSRTNDPGSAQFRNLKISENEKWACIDWNAKNGYGGYGEFLHAELEKIAETWVIFNLKMPESKCNEPYFKATLARESARRAGRDEAVKIISSSRKISEAEASVLARESECSFKVGEFAAYKAMFAEQKVENVSDANWAPKPSDVKLMESYRVALANGCKYESPK